MPSFLVTALLTFAAASLGHGGHGSQAGAPELIEHWQASIEGTYFTSYQIDLFVNDDGTFKADMTKLNGREPVWRSSARGRYKVERSVAPRYEYARAWMVTLEPAEFVGDQTSEQVMTAYGLPINKPISVRLQYSPPSLGGNFPWPTLTYDGEPGTSGFSLNRVAKK